MKKKALVTLMSVVVILLAFSSGMAIDTVPLPERQRMQQTQQLKQTQQTQQLQQLQRMRMTIKAPTRIHKATTIEEARKVIPTPPTYT